MTASVLKQDPNTKRFKPTFVYFNPMQDCWHVPRLPTIFQAPNKLLKLNQDKSFSLISIVFDRLSVV